MSDLPVDALLNQELLAPEFMGLMATLMLKNGLFLATAESCTGGMIAAACTDLAGSSACLSAALSPIPTLPKPSCWVWMRR